MNGVIEALGNYLELAGDKGNGDVMKILKKAHHKQGDKAKATEVQARIDAL